MKDKRIQELINIYHIRVLANSTYSKTKSWFYPKHSFLKDLNNFPCGFCKVKKGFGKTGFIDINGNFLKYKGEEFPFDFAFDFTDGMTHVKINKKDFHFTIHGLLLVPLRNHEGSVVAKRREDLILKEFPFGSMKFYIFRKIYDR